MPGRAAPVRLLRWCRRCAASADRRRERRGTRCALLTGNTWQRAPCLSIRWRADLPGRAARSLQITPLLRRNNSRVIPGGWRERYAAPAATKGWELILDEIRGMAIPRSCGPARPQAETLRPLCPRQSTPGARRRPGAALASNEGIWHERGGP
ncbi:hypothetical protein LNP74_05165 [Klebsiella pneumoniae subsp. pneumoniae]|nr:hypothetical protein [Klebsiella pneumoniae subsp. pneumoniae]